MSLGLLVVLSFRPFWGARGAFGGEKGRPCESWRPEGAHGGSKGEAFEAKGWARQASTCGGSAKNAKKQRKNETKHKTHENRGMH